MNKVFKNLHVFFLFLAVLLLNAHMIIPHDHHQSESDTCQGDSFPVSKNNTRHHSGFPAHCHIFNVLTVEKAITYFSIKHVQSRDLVTVGIITTEISDIQLFWIRIFDLITPPANSVFLELSSLRAPPSIS